ncbi:hypothetical protein ACFX15_034173 [Malus domestica]|uniref:Uncharacterized protein n=1 Tax=Malus domestica TaxID=3750 RepID=A0A498JNL9_MALDO|nr:hypothetical protein DVH24_007885 [Malus domestica]
MEVQTVQLENSRSLFPLSHSVSLSVAESQRLNETLKTRCVVLSFHLPSSLARPLTSHRSPSRQSPLFSPFQSHSPPLAAKCSLRHSNLKFVFFFSFSSLVSPQIFFRFFDASAIVQEIQEIPNSANEKLVSLDLIFGFPASDGVVKDFMGNCEVGLVSDGEFVTTKTAKTMDDKKKGEGETTTIKYFIWKTSLLTSLISIGVLEIRSESITWALNRTANALLQVLFHTQFCSCRVPIAR